MHAGDAGECRRWIAACIVAGEMIEPAPRPIGDVLAVAEREGVVGLLLRVLSTVEWSASERTALEQAQRKLAMAELAGVAEGRRALSALAGAGLRFLLLKGNALAYWLYASPLERPRVDLDVLVDGEQAAERAVRALLHAGFRSVDGVMPASAAGYEVALQREGDARGTPAIDLHWRLMNRSFLAEGFPFDELWSQSIPLPTVHASARGLGRGHALAHAALHRVSNMPTGKQDRLVWLYDIHLLAQGCNDAEWKAFAGLCGDKRIATPVLDGLRASKEAFATRVPAAVQAALETMSFDDGWRLDALSDQGGIDRAHLAALPWRERGHWLWHKLFPSPEFMRHRYGASSRPQLARAYLSRIWVGARRAIGL